MRAPATSEDGDPPPPADRGLWSDGQLEALRGNLRDERSSRWLYRGLADLDERPGRARILRDLAAFEERHAGIWERLLDDLGEHSVPPVRFPEHRAMVALARLFGVGAVLPLVHRGEIDGIQKYRRQQASWKDPAAQAAFRTILPDEVAHEIETGNSARTVIPGSGSLRSALLGANDGLGSVLALAAGVAGATGSSGTVLVAGIAGLVAGAVSMAASNYVSVKAEHEGIESERELERQALEVAPATKRRQLGAILRARGLRREEADAVIDRIGDDRDLVLRALLTERGINPDAESGPSAGRLAGYTGLAFALSAIVPLLPYVALAAVPATVASVIVTGAALFITGTFRALATGQPFLRSGGEMLAVGLGAAAATYGVGLLVGTYAAVSPG